MDGIPGTGVAQSVNTLYGSGQSTQAQRVVMMAAGGCQAIFVIRSDKFSTLVREGRLGAEPLPPIGCCGSDTGANCNHRSARKRVGE